MITICTSCHPSLIGLGNPKEYRIAVQHSTDVRERNKIHTYKGHVPYAINKWVYKSYFNLFHLFQNLFCWISQAHWQVIFQIRCRAAAGVFLIFFSDCFFFLCYFLLLKSIFHLGGREAYSSIPPKASVWHKILAFLLTVCQGTSLNHFQLYLLQSFPVFFFCLKLLSA